MGRVNILAFSDIHNNVRAVEALRKKEKPRFDVVIVAGDMGDDRAEDIFEIVSGYDCPILYIYGNWDNRLSYSQQFAENCIHLHQKSVSVNGYTFAGFSGCPTHWGKNPVAEELFLNVQNDFSEHLHVVNALEKEIDNAAASFTTEIKATKHLYNEYISALIPKTKKSKDKIEERMKFFKTKIRYKSDKKVKEFEKIILLNEKKIDVLNKPLNRLLKSKGHMKYEAALRKSYKEAENENRRLLIEKLKDEKNEFYKTFLIAHERLYKTDLDAPGLLCHIFGHRHGFKHTVFKGTNFINVSALDDEDSLGAGPGTYCILKADGSDLEVYCKSIKKD